MNLLDDPETIERLDPSGMIDRVGELPEQCRAAWEQVQALRLPAHYRQAKGVVIAGMGGSAIGGDLVRSLAVSEARVPIQVCREYDLPTFVGPDTLVIASSYSGDTEETLSAFQQALDKGTLAVAVCTGGKLKAMAEKAGVPVLTFHYSAQPRAALGYSVMLLLGLLQEVGMMADKSADVAEAATVLGQLREELGPTVPEARNLAKQLALAIYGRVPVVYGGGLLSEVARRWKGQFNENAKSLAALDVLPELNHNAVVGYRFPGDLPDSTIVILLQSSLNHPRVQARCTITQEILAQYHIPCRAIHARGQSALVQMMSAIYVGDYASCYLALLYGVDPTPVEVISWLKARLARLDPPEGL